MRITVIGRATSDVPAELAVLRLTVTGRATTRERAFELAATRASALEPVLDSHAATIDDRSDGPFGLHEEREHVDGSWRRTGYRATRTTELTLTDWSGIVGLLAEATAAADVDIDGPHFELRPDSEAIDDVRADAAHDARRSALAYTRGLDLHVGSVLDVREPGTTPPADGDDPIVVSSQRMASELLPTEPTTTGRVQVNAEVQVTFELADPGARADAHRRATIPTSPGERAARLEVRSRWRPRRVAGTAKPR